jgi:hypothetical protein
VKKCGAEIGIFFLLQVLSFLLASSSSPSLTLSVSVCLSVGLHLPFAFHSERLLLHVPLRRLERRETQNLSREAAVSRPEHVTPPFLSLLLSLTLSLLSHALQLEIDPSPAAVAWHPQGGDPKEIREPARYHQWPLLTSSLPPSLLQRTVDLAVGGGDRRAEH